MNNSRRCEETVVTKVLLEKYKLLKQEAFLQSGYFKSHTRTFQFVVTGVLTIVGFSLSKQLPMPSAATWSSWWTFATMLWIAMHYLVFDLFESQYHLSILVERLATIEERLNQELGERVLIYETKICPRYWSVFHPTGNVINPEWFLSAFACALVLFCAVIIPISIYLQLLDIAVASNSDWRAIFASAGLFCSVACALLTMFVGRKVLFSRGHLRRHFEEMLQEPLDPRLIIREDLTKH
jgi:hypothetical protein